MTSDNIHISADDVLIIHMYGTNLKKVVHWYEINNLKKFTCFQSWDLSAVGALIIVFCFGNPIHSGMLSFE